MTRKAEKTKRKDESNHDHKSKHAGLRCIQTACSHWLIGRILCERWVAVLGHDIASTVAKMYCPCRLVFSCTAVINMGRWIHLPTVEAPVDRCNRNGLKTLMVQRYLFSSSSKEPSHYHRCRHCCLRCLVVAIAIAKAAGVHYQRDTITKRNRVTRAFRLPPQQHEGIRIHLIESGRRTD